MPPRRRRPPTDEEARQQNEAAAPAPPLPEIPTFDGEHRLAAKLAWITGQVGFIPKRGWNAHFGYPFVREADLKAHVAPLLSALRVFLLADVVDHEKAGDLTTLTVRWTFIDGETNEQLSGTMVGYGSDRGDKGANKAMTAALKFFLIPTFLVVSGDDAEADVTTDVRSEQQEQRPVEVRSSGAQQPRRGGHSDAATSMQLQQVSELSQTLDLGAQGVADVVKRVLNVEIALPAEGQAGALARGLLALSADNLGKVVTALRKQVEAIDEVSKDGDDDGLPDIAADIGIGY